MGAFQIQPALHMGGAELPAAMSVSRGQSGVGVSRRDA